MRFSERLRPSNFPRVLLAFEQDVAFLATESERLCVDMLKMRVDVSGELKTKGVILYRRFSRKQFHALDRSGRSRNSTFQFEPFSLTAILQ